jgi:hypothetical protein
MRDIEIAHETRKLRFSMWPQLERLSRQRSPETPCKKSAQRHPRYFPRRVESIDFPGRAIGIPRLTFGQRFTQSVQIDEPQLNRFVARNSAPAETEFGSARLRNGALHHPA